MLLYPGNGKKEKKEMNKNWLFLRGEFDCRTQKSIDDDDDMWLQLFMEMSTSVDVMADIFFRSMLKPSWNGEYQNAHEQIVNIEYKGNKGSKPAIFSFGDISSNKAVGFLGEYDLIFARGGFDYYLPILKDNPEAYKIYYGAGRRYVPEPGINYNLILCDSEKQKKEILEKYPNTKVELFIKPAAKHFKPIECKKEYDVCYIANETQGHFKGVQWVYETAPKDLKILHLGNFTGKYHAPENVTRKHVDRIDMPKWISKCKVGIVPYFNQIDSCPRIIPEMLACGLPLVVADELNFWRSTYMDCRIGRGVINGNGFATNVRSFWKWVYHCIGDSNQVWSNNISNYYQENLSIPVAAKHIRSLINQYGSY